MRKSNLVVPQSGRVVVLGGTGNVGNVVLHKLLQSPEIFKEVHVGIRHPYNYDQRYKDSLKALIKKKGNRTSLKLHSVTVPVDANISKENFKRLVHFLQLIKPDLVMNLCPPFCNMAIMQACLISGVHYLDTACYEHPDKLGFSNKKQLALDKQFKESGLVAQLQIGFDPGVSNLMVADCVQGDLFDEIFSVDIMDCNNGRGKRKAGKVVYWSTNFDPEVNIRELCLPVKAVHNSKWTQHGRLIDPDPIYAPFKFPEAGRADAYLMYHEELESLHRSFPLIPTMRFWMTFSREYLTHLRVHHEDGTAGISSIKVDGQSIVPLHVLKACLPTGTDFNDSYKGKTNIGCIIRGIKNGKDLILYIYQVCDHQEAFKETLGNAIGYTTGVPPVIAASLMLGENGVGGGPWLSESGVFVPEDNSAKVFLDKMADAGLPWKVKKLQSMPEHLKEMDDYYK